MISLFCSILKVCTGSAKKHEVFILIGRVVLRGDPF